LSTDLDDFVLSKLTDTSKLECTTTEIPRDFARMLGEQTLLCQTGEAGEIVPTTFDELVGYLDIEGFGDGDVQEGGDELDKTHTTGGLDLDRFTTFGTEDKWPI